MLFSAISGTWQIFRQQESRKDGSYQAPLVLQRLSQVHKVVHLRGAAVPLPRWAGVLAAAIFVTTGILGIMMAVRLGRPRWLPVRLLGLGIAAPLTIAWAALGG
ncbi:MAG: hypothetical protein U0X73_14040 [Thermoanaerobaculia bacterium]